jgi:hypothetical protein
MPMNLVKIAGVIASEPTWRKDQCTVRMAFNETSKRTDQFLSITANETISPEVAKFPVGSHVFITGYLVVSNQRGVQIKVNSIVEDYFHPEPLSHHIEIPTEVAR